MRSGAREPRVPAVMLMERLADFVSKSLEGGEIPAPPFEPDPDETDDVEVDITELDEKQPPAKRPRNWLLSPVPVQQCKRETDDDDDHRHGKCFRPSHVPRHKTDVVCILLLQHIME